MIPANPAYASGRLTPMPRADSANATPKADDAVAPAAPAGTPEVAISSLAGRLARAASAFGSSTAGLNRSGLADKVLANIRAVLYPLDDEHKAAAALQAPEPNDASSAASAAAATAFVDDSSRPNPFAGLSRDQLATISSDESGTFTINEKRAAFMQAYSPCRPSTRNSPSRRTRIRTRLQPAACGAVSWAPAWCRCSPARRSGRRRSA